MNNILLCLVLLSLTPALAFVPRTLIVSTASSLSTTRLSAWQPPLVDAVLSQTASTADISATATTLSSSSSIYLSDAADILRNFGLVIGALVIIVVGFVTLFSTVIIPAAAQQLEEQAKRDYPLLWDEIAEANFRPGESLVQRPDIMQALGTKVRERITADFDRAQAAAAEEEKQGGIIEAEIVKEDKEE